MPANKFILSLRALKQLNIAANMKKAKNAVSRYMLSVALLKFEVKNGSLRNASDSAMVKAPRDTI